MGSLKTGIQMEGTSTSDQHVSGQQAGAGGEAAIDISSCANLCYQPVTTFEELMSYGTGECGLIREVCRKKTVPLLSDNFCTTRIRLGGGSKTNVDNSGSGKRPLTLVCHDLKGGYGDDR